jgi:hypothetical protein
MNASPDGLHQRYCTESNLVNGLAPRYCDEADPKAAALAFAPTLFERRCDGIGASNAPISSASLFDLRGEWDFVEACVNRLLQHASHHSLAPYMSFVLSFRGATLMKRGAIDDSIAMRQSFNSLREQRYENYLPWLNITLAEGYAARGRLDERWR